MQELSHFATIANPEEVALRRAQAVVGNDELGRVLLEKRGVPKMSCGRSAIHTGVSHAKSCGS
jgi:hypothetical protein